MRKIVAPDHIKEFCRDDIEGDNVFEELKTGYEDSFSNVFKVVCTCNNPDFWIYGDEHPTIILECAECKRRITAYDLKYYPSAIKLDESYELKRLNEKKQPVYVNYEYSDEYLYSKDVSFDNNDITWCKIFVNDNGVIKKILDDETA